MIKNWTIWKLPRKTRRLLKTVADEIVLKLVKTKCLPIPLYGLEACPLNKTNLRSLDFSVNRFFMTVFTTSDMHVSSVFRGLLRYTTLIGPK